MVWSRHLIAAALLCAALCGPSPASPTDPQSPKADQPVPNRADAKRPKAEQEELKTRDLEKLQGKWVIVREQASGQVQKGDRGTYTFRDNTLTYTFKDSTRNSGTFTIDVSQRPKSLTWTFRNKEDEKKVTIAFAYAFDDDHLLLKYSTYEWKYHDTPPTDFGSNTATFLRLERASD